MLLVILIPGIIKNDFENVEMAKNRLSIVSKHFLFAYIGLATLNELMDHFHEKGHFIKKR